MTNCECCHEVMLDNQVCFGTVHEVCFLERQARQDCGMCVQCGKNNDQGRTRYTCSECERTNADYKEYKGPGQ